MEEKNLKEKIDENYEFIEKLKAGGIKIKGLKLPRKAKVRKSKIKKGWVGILTVKGNRNVDGEKQKVEDWTYKLKDGTYHATDGREILFYKGKHPFVIQRTDKLNPINLYQIQGEKNETYGQKHVMARMIKDATKLGKKSGGWLIFIVIAIAAFIAYQLFFK